MPIGYAGMFAIIVGILPGSCQEASLEDFQLDGATLQAIQHVFPSENDTCLQTFSCCRGSALTVSEELWKHVKAFAPNYHIRELLDSTPRMLERHYTFLNMYRNMQQTSAQLWAADCYFGVVGILLNALPAAEFEFGLESAQYIFHMVEEMLKRNSDMIAANWSIPTEPLESSFPFLLQLRPNNCHSSSLRVYVYNTGNYSLGSVFCSAGQWGVEVLIHRYFGSSACRTMDPDNADFFLVPDYRACHFHLAPTFMHTGLTRIEGDSYHSQIIWNHKDKYRNASQADDLFKKLVKSLDYFERRKGIDHIFIFSDQGFIVNFTHTFPSWRDIIPNSILITTEAFTPGCGPSCFSPWKDIVIPGHIDQNRYRAIRAASKPSRERTLLFNFHGRLPVNHEYYENNTVRRAILRFAPLPDVSIGGFIENYFEVMGDSHFCIVPEGTSSWTNHLYESFFAGCIPLILSDRFVLPFQDLIDWSQLSIRWPQESVNDQLYHYIHELVHNRRPVVELMKSNLEKAACWFDFYAFDDACSPYRGIVHALEQRKKSMPKYLHPSHWMV